MSDAAWKFLEVLVVVLIGPAVMIILNNRQTTKIQTRADVREAKLDEVAVKVAKTETIVNGEKTAREQRIKALENQLRQAGHEPLI